MTANEAAILREIDSDQHMKKTEISAAVFERLDSKPLAKISGGELKVPVGDLAGLALVPWFCDESVQWALRISQPGKPLKKSLLKKVNDSFISEENGAVLIGVPGDGIEPSTFTLFPLAEAVAKVVIPGMTLELATANLGVVKRDWEIKAETSSVFGDQRYVGPVNADGTWTLTQSTPALTRDQLETALACGRKVAKNGPWEVKDKAEAADVLMHWMKCPASNINPMAVKRFIQFKNGELVNTDPGMERKLSGLGLGFFRRSLAGGPFGWGPTGPQRHPEQTYQDVVKTVLC
jgi:hypothetical protein